MVIGVNEAFFSKSGKLLSFTLYYNGEKLPIVLVPKRKWLDEGLSFIKDWLAPIGITIGVGAMAYNLTKNKRQNHEEYQFTNLTQTALAGLGIGNISFFTSGIEDSNLIYVNSKTGTVYYDSPIYYNASGIFN